MTTEILRSLVIDDEPKARELLEKYIAKVPHLQLVGSIDNPLDALFQVKKLLPDLIFLDIEMQEMTGFEFLKLLPPIRPAIIMVTADPTYALEGFEHQVSDYLLKPVAFDRFLKAINKVFSEREFQSKPMRHPLEEAINDLSSTKEENKIERTPLDFILVKENGKQVKIDLTDIIFVEGMKDYLKLYWGNRVSVVHMTMAKIEELLPESRFLRTHRSYIVNKSKIREIDNNEITTTNDVKISIGITYRPKVVAAFLKNRV